MVTFSLNIGEPFEKSVGILILEHRVTIIGHFIPQYFSYVMSVLFPECIIRLIMDFHSISFEKVMPIYIYTSHYNYYTVYNNYSVYIKNTLPTAGRKIDVQP